MEDPVADSEDERRVAQYLIIPTCVNALSPSFRAPPCGLRRFSWLQRGVQRRARRAVRYRAGLSAKRLKSGENSAPSRVDAVRRAYVQSCRHFGNEGSSGAKETSEPHTFSSRVAFFQLVSNRRRRLRENAEYSTEITTRMQTEKSSLSPILKSWPYDLESPSPSTSSPESVCVWYAKYETTYGDQIVHLFLQVFESQLLLFILLDQFVLLQSEFLLLVVVSVIVRSPVSLEAETTEWRMNLCRSANSNSRRASMSWWKSVGSGRESAFGGGLA